MHDDEFRHAQGQLDLFEEEPKGNGTALAIAIVMVAIVIGLLFIPLL